MENINKKPDQKLALGAKIGFITNIITSIFGAIMLIVAIVAIALTKKVVNGIPGEVDPSGSVAKLANGLSTGLLVFVIIFMLILIALSIFIAIKCKHILQGKAENGMIIGIVLLVIAGLSLITCAFGTGAILGSLVIAGLNIAAGVLLIMGKYVSPPANAAKEVEVTSTEVK